METGEKGEGRRECLKGIMKAKEENEKGTRMEKREGKGQRERRGGRRKGEITIILISKRRRIRRIGICSYCRAETYLSHPGSGHRAGTWLLIQMHPRASGCLRPYFRVSLYYTGICTEVADYMPEGSWRHRTKQNMISRKTSKRNGIAVLTLFAQYAAESM